MYGSFHSLRRFLVFNGLGFGTTVLSKMIGGKIRVDFAANWLTLSRALLISAVILDGPGLLVGTRVGSVFFALGALFLVCSMGWLMTKLCSVAGETLRTAFTLPSGMA